MSRAKGILESVEMVRGIKVSVNPRTLEQLLREIGGHPVDGMVRFIYDFTEDKFYFFDGYETDHPSMSRKAGIEQGVYGYIMYDDRHKRWYRFYGTPNNVQSWVGKYKDKLDQRMTMLRVS